MALPRNVPPAPPFAPPAPPSAPPASGLPQRAVRQPSAPPLADLPQRDVRQPSAPPAPPPFELEAEHSIQFELDEEGGFPSVQSIKPADEAAHGTALASAEHRQEMSASPASSGRGDILATASEMGFTGLDLDAFGVLPTISLKEGVYQTGDGSINLGESFLCHMYGSKPKYIYKTSLPLVNGKPHPDSEILYSFDDVVSTTGVNLKKRKAEWEAKGIEWQPKKYVDIRIGILRDEHDNEPRLALLSVPPTSVANFTNISLQLLNWCRSTGNQPGERVVKVSKGPKVMKVAFPFHPMKFELLPAL